ncbi:glycosyltransferase family 2 protein [Flavobacterium sp. GCM10023249]|uniref:glycosyltransferase family 2 protein n=1 Tax=unclassified Flavobacterium TaxID=196869 RepID=UPI003605B64C
MNPIISIIIPSYNKASFIKDTLQSVLNQSYLNWECIIIDDGSTDDSELIIKDFANSDPRFVFLPKDIKLPKGPSSSRNLGIQKAKGEFVLFLDADDLLSSDCLENRMKYFEENKDNDFLVFQMQRFQTQPDYSVKRIKFDISEELVLHSFIHLHGVWAITSPIYKTQLLKSVRGFDEKLTNFEDFELAVKVILKSGRYKFFDIVDCYYRNDEDYVKKYSNSKAKLRMLESFCTFIQSIDAFLLTEKIDDFKKIKVKGLIVSSYKKLFKGVVIEDVKLLGNQNKQILNILSQKNYLSQWQSIKYNFVQRVLFQLYFVKGIGLFKLMKIIYK